MSKFGNFFSKSIDKVKKIRTNDWPDERVNKWAKIASFFTGFIFNLLGIIAVAVWKYIFCNNENKSKYCVRIAILGMVAEIVLFAKFFAFSSNRHLPIRRKRREVLISSHFPASFC